MTKTAPQLPPTLLKIPHHTNVPAHPCGLWALWVGRWVWVVGTTPTGGRLATVYDLACNRPIHGGSSVESGLELRILQARPCH
ncbi:hypothetical protein AVEN_27232-1 [Araneus ventricosus]|uniref:Uncharacterized protein n=1 Tax=Araneus ventricosus TaxID=182803 RepID=A0A4Y2C9K3_ARAVE|nr:hypothetical protein AVEN_27232-1 [Araneus ventricosus]